MTRQMWRMLGALGLLSFLTLPAAFGQAPGAPPPRRPALSPYLNLNRPGGSPAFNYATLVRPQQQTLQSVQQLQQQTQVNQTNIGRLQEQTQIPPTGHASTFMNHGGFFMNNQGGVGAVSPADFGKRPAGITRGGRRGR